MFRSTGQSPINHTSSDHESVDFEPNDTRDADKHVQAQQIHHRTLSKAEEENCTAGSGTDVHSESPYSPGGTGIADEARDQSELSQDDEEEEVEEEGPEGKGEESEEKKVVEVNETYAKYLLEKKRLAEELKEKSE